MENKFKIMGIALALMLAFGCTYPTENPIAPPANGKDCSMNQSCFQEALANCSAVNFKTVCNQTTNEFQLDSTGGACMLTKKVGASSKVTTETWMLATPRIPCAIGNESVGNLSGLFTMSSECIRVYGCQE